MNVNDLNEEELMTLESLMTNKREWGVITKLFQRQIALYWDILRRTDPADEARVSANHKLAVGVESSLGNFVKEIEDVIHERQTRSSAPTVIDDLTRELYT